MISFMKLPCLDIQTVNNALTKTNVEIYFVTFRSVFCLQIPPIFQLLSQKMLIILQSFPCTLNICNTANENNINFSILTYKIIMNCVFFWDPHWKCLKNWFVAVGFLICFGGETSLISESSSS